MKIPAIEADVPGRSVLPEGGVMLSELVPEEGQQTDLFAYSSSNESAG
jgi:hypothetical protein